MEAFKKIVSNQIEAFKLNRQALMLAHQAKLVILERDCDSQEAMAIGARLGKNRWFSGRMEFLR